MSNSFKDLFSVQASDYAKYRPTYPDELYQYLSSIVTEHDAVWDCGTGNGQAAIQLAKYFSQVFATDPSQKQLTSAIPHKKIRYSQASAEESGLDSHSVNLVTVAQAFHWFKHDAFADEVLRVAKPNAILAVWCYELARISPEIDQAINQFYKGTLGPYWEKERQLVEEGYRNIKLPFKEIQSPKFIMYAEWDIAHLIGYLNTWSALQTFIKKNSRNPLEEIYNDLEKLWQTDKNKKVTWDMGFRVWKV